MTLSVINEQDLIWHEDAYFTSKIPKWEVFNTVK